jgi:hypothetical protein
VILTVEAVTAPVDPVFPIAVTQSPVASVEDVVDCVSDNVVILAMVTLSFTALVLGAFLDLDLLVGLPPFTKMPDIDTDEPLTAVTLPLAIARLPPGNDPPPARPLPPLKPLGGEPPLGIDPPLGGPPLPNDPPPPGNPPPPKPPRLPAAHVPDDEGWLIVMERAVILVLDFLAGVPVTVRQSPTTTADAVSLSV